MGFGKSAQLTRKTREEEPMLLQEIGPDTTMEEILRAYPSAKIGLFQRYHIGGCAS